MMGSVLAALNWLIVLPFFFEHINSPQKRSRHSYGCTLFSGFHT